ncbi:hypothetical protein [Succinimonas sp.]|uniref:hypothetical protein n=1 Tax=Succinimonas sp. TaxID=1936151 RepID=UPI00386306E6
MTNGSTTNKASAQPGWRWWFMGGGYMALLSFLVKPDLLPEAWSGGNLPENGSAFSAALAAATSPGRF